MSRVLHPRIAAILSLVASLCVVLMLFAFEPNHGLEWLRPLFVLLAIFFFVSGVLLFRWKPKPLDMARNFD